MFGSHSLSFSWFLKSLVDQTAPKGLRSYAPLLLSTMGASSSAPTYMHDWDEWHASLRRGGCMRDTMKTFLLFQFKSHVMH